MGARVYVLSLNEKLNIVGIYTNIRQVHQAVKILDLPTLDTIFLHEIRMNESPSATFGRECKYILVQKREELLRHAELLEIQRLKKEQEELTGEQPPQTPKKEKKEKIKKS